MAKTPRTTGSAPIGSFCESMLTESQFQELNGAGWVLADGRSVAGTMYAAVTGKTTVPDCRGMVLRGKNNGRSDGEKNPDITLSATRVSGSTTITGLESNNSKALNGHSLYPGMTVTGTGIPAGTKVVSVTTSSAVLSKAATASGTSNLTFSGELDLGQYQPDAIQGHNHRSHSSWFVYNSGSSQALTEGSYNNGALKTREPVSDGTSGEPRTGPETRMKNITVNVFIRVN